MQILDIVFWTGIIAIPIAGIWRAFDAYKNPHFYSDYARRQYQDKLDSHPEISDLALIDEAKFELADRRREIDSLGLEIDRLSQEKNKTGSEILELIDRLRLVGLAKNNRKKYVTDLVLTFALGVSTSILSNLLWSYFVI